MEILGKKLPIIKQVFFSNVEDVFNDPCFLITLGNEIGRRCTISELLELLNSLRPGEEKNWILRIDEFLEDIEKEENFAEYILDMENLRELVRTYLCMFFISPRVLYLIKNTLVYLLILLEYGRINRLSEFVELEMKELETGEEDLFLTTYTRAFFTVTYVSIYTFITHIKEITFNQSFSPSAWMGNIPKLLDKQVWIEFNEYLQECGDVFTPLSTFTSAGGGVCAVM